MAAAVLNYPASSVQTKAFVFTETGAGVYTGTLVLPLGSYVLDVRTLFNVAWGAATSAVLIVGDADDADGFIESTNLLVIPVGVPVGVYKSGATGFYSASARSVIAKITSVGAGTAGRTTVLVTYVTPVQEAVAAA